MGLKGQVDGCEGWIQLGSQSAETCTPWERLMWYITSSRSAYSRPQTGHEKRFSPPCIRAMWRCRFCRQANPLEHRVQRRSLVIRPSACNRRQKHSESLDEIFEHFCSKTSNHEEVLAIILMKTASRTTNKSPPNWTELKPKRHCVGHSTLECHLDIEHTSIFPSQLKCWEYLGLWLSVAQCMCSSNGVTAVLCYATDEIIIENS